MTVCVVLVAQALTLDQLRADSAGRPNLVLILADDLGYGDVGFHGSTEVRTPNLDRLASEGLMMTQMRANCTVCSPTRAAILTGIYADRAGVPGVIRTKPENSWGYLKPGLPTLADRLGEAGYHTGIVGKWHLGLTAENHPCRRGFDHFHGFLGDMMDDYYTHRREGFNYMRLNETEIEPTGHATELFTQWAIDYMKEQSGAPEKPFFLYLAYNAPHFPIQPPEEWFQKVRNRDPELTEARAKNVAFVEHLDDQIGVLLKRMDELGLRDNTLLVFTSDNGGSLPHSQNNDPWRDGKQSHYDGGLKVPYVVRYPGKVKAGSQSDYQGLNFDSFATFLQYGGVRTPDDINAVGLKEHFEGGPAPDSDRELYFVRREGGAAYVGHAYHALIRGKWKLMQNDPFSPLQLFDLENDPQETTNVIDGNRQVAMSMKKALAGHIQIGGHTAWQGPRDE
ncbi:sulfatase family protein [Neorhodopirellula pilleata]|nr:sulfatase-like hydrolase/transferase [Neorhodopirellula pilleata]